MVKRNQQHQKVSAARRRPGLAGRRHGPRLVVADLVSRLDANMHSNLTWRSLGRPETPPTASVAEVANHCLWFVDACAAELTSLVGHRVSLSVKFLWILEPDAQPLLRTLVRSSGTRLEREAQAPHNNSEYWENSAFKSLLHEWPVRSDFSEDDLRKLWLHGKYQNSNRGWMEFYNSTSVVAIPQSKAGSALPVGFLCADSLLGRLAETNVAGFLGDAARHIYDIISILVRVEGKHAHFSPQAVGATAIQLPCGWQYVNDKLIAGDRDEQYKFQSILEKLEDFYLSERTAPAIRQGREAPLLEEEIVPDDDKLFPELQHPEYAAIMGPQPNPPSLSPEELDKVLERMAVFNPDAAEMLRLRREA